MNKKQRAEIRKKEKELLKQAKADRARGIKTGPWSGLKQIGKYKSGVVRHVSPEDYLREKEEEEKRNAAG